MVHIDRGGSATGAVYWEPGWVAAGGSPWENLCLWNDRGEALPAMGVLGEQIDEVDDRSRHPAQSIREAVR